MFINSSSSGLFVVCMWMTCIPHQQVIDPDDLPEKGLNINGESIQPPSEEVLELREKTPGVVFLVRFFDGRRTW